MTGWLAFFALLTVYFYYESRTQQFRLQDILGELTSGSCPEVEGVDQKLKQKFHYLGSGKQSHAFLGEDGKTVLKFLRHNDQSFERFLKKNSIPLEAWYGKLMVRYNPQPVMESSQLAYEILPELSGIIYTHFHKTYARHGKVQLVDANYIEHEVNLDETPFYLQNYGELVIARIDRHMKQGEIGEAEKAIQFLFQAIEEWSLKGIQVKHPALRRNIGFYGDRVLLLDVGSLYQTGRLEDREFVYQELKSVTARLRRWLFKYHPQLYPYYQQQLSQRDPVQKDFSVN